MCTLWNRRRERERKQKKAKGKSLWARKQFIKVCMEIIIILLFALLLCCCYDSIGEVIKPLFIQLSFWQPNNNWVVCIIDSLSTSLTSISVCHDHLLCVSFIFPIHSISLCNVFRNDFISHLHQKMIYRVLEKKINSIVPQQLNWEMLQWISDNNWLTYSIIGNFRKELYEMQFVEIEIFYKKRCQTKSSPSIILMSGKIVGWTEIEIQLRKKKLKMRAHHRFIMSPANFINTIAWHNRL